MSKDGRRELGHTVDAPVVRTLQVSGTSSYTLDSPEDEIPLVSEFMVANLALSLVNEVRVRTVRWEYVQTRASGRWTYTGRVR